LVVPRKNPLFRVSQHAGKSLTNMLSLYDIVQSMSGKGQCYDKAYTNPFLTGLIQNWEVAMNQDRFYDRTSLNIYRSSTTEFRRHSALHYKYLLRHERTKESLQGYCINIRLLLRIVEYSSKVLS
jgi:hypothetical protein